MQIDRRTQRHHGADAIAGVPEFPLVRKSSEKFAQRIAGKVAAEDNGGFAAGRR